MSGFDHNQSFDHKQSNDRVVNIGSSEAESILKDIRSLRDRIVTAWRERAVILSAEERAALHSEISQTCKFLEDLTRST